MQHLLELYSPDFITMATEKAEPQAALMATGVEAEKKEDDDVSTSLGSVQIAQTNAIAAQQTWASLTAFFALAGLAIMVAQNQMAWALRPASPCTGAADNLDVLCDPRDGADMWPVQEELLTINVLRAFISFTTLAAVVSLYRYYAHRVKWMVSKTQLAKNSTILSAPALRWKFLLEASCLLVHIPPGIEEGLGSNSGTGPILLYLFLTQFMWVRWYLLVRALKYSSSLLGSNGRFISALTHVVSCRRLLGNLQVS